MEPLKLFDIGARGVNVTADPLHQSPEELTTAQNAEYVSDKGEGAIDQRPGMTRINTAAVGGAVLLAEDIPADLLLEKTATLYAGMYTGSTHNWRKSSDGTTWANADTPVKSFSNNASIAGFFKNLPKCVTLGRKMYYIAGTTPIALHSFDGTTDTTVATVPPAVSGTTLVAPGVFPTNAGGLQFGENGPGGAVTYTYVFVSIAGANNSAPSINATITTGSSPLSGSNYLVVVPLGDAPPAGATRLDVYRTVGGATQGKVGTIPIVAGAYSTGNGSGIGGATFSDAGLVGDGSSPPVAASGAAAGDALAVLDLATDGFSLFLAILDQAVSDPSVYGRVLQYTPANGAWIQIGSSFPLSAGNGGPASLALYDGSWVFGTYIGVASGNTSYVKSLATPLPAGGFPEVHTTASSQATCSIAVFNGDLYVGYVSLVAATAAIVAKRTPVATWSTSLTGVATAQYNAYTSLGVYNGRLFAGWTSGGGATAANIKSTLDGTTWTAEITLGVGEVPGQMVVFGGNLYVVCGRTGAAYNTTTRVLKRDSAGTWTAVDDPADDFAGCLGVVYV